MDAGRVLARVEFDRPARAIHIEGRPTIAYHESIAYDHQERESFLRLDEMFTALFMFTSEHAGAMTSHRG